MNHYCISTQQFKYCPQSRVSQLDVKNIVPEQLPPQSQARPPKRRIAMLAAAATLSIIAIVTTTTHLRKSRDSYAINDFASYYAWGTMYSGGSDLWSATAEASDVAGVPKHPRACNYTPAFVQFFAPLAHLDRQTAFWIWQSLQLLSLAIAMIILASSAEPPFSAAGTAIAVAIAFLFRPLSSMIHYSQFAALLLMMLTASWVSAQRGRAMWAGWWLALATLLKLYPAAAAGYFLFTRQFKVFAWFVAFTSIGVLTSGAGHWIDLFRYGIANSLKETSPIQIGVMGALGSAGANSNLPLSGALIAAIDAALIAITIITTVRAGAGSNTQGLAFSLWMILGLELSPVVWPHELPLAIPAYLFAALTAWQLYSERSAVIARPWFIGGVVLTGTIATHDFTTLIPGVHPRFLALILTYLGAAMLLHAHTLAERIEQAQK